MKTLIYSLIIILAIPFISFSQEKVEKKDYGIKFSGFVKSDIFFDSRQTISVREGHFHLYPANEDLDVNGEDINAKSGFNMLSIQSRLKGSITGPDAFGAKTSGVIEGAFFGHSESIVDGKYISDINGFRLRHAFGKLKWEKSELLFGQYWNPMFIADCFPGVVSFNTGAPFQPFSRNPQLRYSYSLGKIKIIAAVLSQRDFTSSGGSGTLRNSSIPDMHLQIHFDKKDKEAGKQFLFGLGGSYKILTPRLKTEMNYMATGSDSEEGNVCGLSGMAFIKYKIPAITIKLEGVYGQNMTDLTMLGGYAVMDTTGDADYKTNMDSFDYRQYTTLDAMSFWLDIHTNGKKFQVGLFAGYTKNLGSLHNILGYGEDDSYFSSRGSNIDHVYRISPRLIFNSGKVRFATEFEYTIAGYGTAVNSLGEVQDGSVDYYSDAEIKDIANLRILLGVYYFF